MSESDFGKKTAAAETGRHHDKQHRTSFGKTTSRRSSNQRTRATHHSKNRHQKGTTLMKRKASATALVLFIVTLLLVTTTTSKAATFSAGDNTFSCATNFTNPTAGLDNTYGGTRFAPAGTVYTGDNGKFATGTGSQYTITWRAAKTTPRQSRFTNNRITTVASNTATARSDGQTGRFTIPQDTVSNFTVTDTSEFFDETNPDFDQFFF
jgi:hypothetical protein